MKKLISILLCIAMLISLMGLCTSAAFTNGSIAITCEDGQIVVSGTFTGSEAGESYKVILANYNEDTSLKRIIGISDPVEITSGTNTVSYSVDMPDLMAESELVKAYIWTESLEPICAPAQKEITSLKVLAIGSSFNQDSTRLLYYIAEDAGIDNIVIANIFNGSSTLREHTENAANDAAEYVYYKNSTGDWLKETDKKTIEYGLKDEKWNVIILNQGAKDSPNPLTYEGEDGYLTNFIKYVNDNKSNPDARLAWNTAWAIRNDYDGANYVNYTGNQLGMYTDIVNAVKEHVVPKVENGTLSLLIPSGTAMQNVRTSFIGDTVDRDGLHASENIGRYTLALTLFKSITGKSLDELTYVPKNLDDVMITDDRLLAIKDAVDNAIANPLEITQSEYTAEWYASRNEENINPLVDTPTGVKLDFDRVTAEASNATGTYVAANVTDGDLTTRWSSKLQTNKVDGPHSLVLDLGTVATISELGIKWLYDESRNYYFSIEVSDDGVSYRSVENLGVYDPDCTKCPQSTMLLSKAVDEMLYFDMGNEKARYIRFWGLGNDSEDSAVYYNHVFEIEAYLQPEKVAAPFGEELTDVTKNTETADGTEIITLDLGAVDTVTDIGISWADSATTQYDFMLETSADGITYTPVKNFGTADAPIKSALTAGMQYFNIVNEDVQYIRYTGDAGVSDIKVYLKDAPSSDPDIVTGEVETVTGTKLDQGTITATHSKDNVGKEQTDHPASATLDGDSTTYWTVTSGSNKDKKGIITFDLGGIKTVSGIQIEWLSNKSGRKYNFYIQVSTDGETWSYIDNMGTDEAVIQNSALSVNYSLGDVRAQYIRYVGYGATNNSNNQLCEFNAYVK